MRTVCLAFWVCCAQIAVFSLAYAGDLDVVITEINYNPASGSNADEFVEIFNRGPLAVDLSDWRLDDGVFLTIPPGLVLQPGSYLVLSPNATITANRYQIQNVFGDYSGSLANGGEIVSLVNARGETISRFRYDDNAPWPESPDGLGPSLELRDPTLRTDIADHWQASRSIGGTPSRINSVVDLTVPPGIESEAFVVEGDEWRYFKGVAPFPSGWTAVDFDDTDWLTGPSGIGYGDGDDNTVLSDMRLGYLSFAARREFNVTQEQLDKIASIEFRIVYDDAFAAFLNGGEIRRAGLGEPGVEVPHDMEADGPIEPTTVTVLLPAFALSVGDNVLAVQIHNRDLDSSDASCIPSLTGSSGPPTRQVEDEFPVKINEIKPTEAGSPGFVELYNRGTESMSIGGFHLVDHLSRRYTIAAGTMLDLGDWLALDDATLGFDLQLSGSTYMLLDADDKWVGGMDPRVGLLGENGFSFGLVPDGDGTGYVLGAPTSGDANVVTLETNVIVNEIYFHPPFIPPEGECLSDCSDLDQWIEVYNRGPEMVDLSGWQITSAFDFVFPVDSSIEAGGFLVLTPSRDRFLAAHATVEPTRVLGDWTRALSHGSDRIRLRDELGNIVQEVIYGDGKPLNDEDPVDDVDDQTFVGSDWPRESDGSGGSIELVNPALDATLGGAWRDGPVGGTPAAANQALTATPPPAIGAVTHLPPVPNSIQSVVVECRVSSSSILSSVSVVWRVDGSGSATVDPMNDAGLEGDVIAGDGLFSATLPPQPSGAVVAFEIEAVNADATTRVPPVPAVEPYAGFVGPFYLYQVRDQGLIDNGSTNYLIVMTAADQAELESRDEFSNVLLPSTFIAREDGARGVFHHVGLRYRGSQTRMNARKSYRVEFPSERPFMTIEDLNLQASQVDSEILAADFMHRAGLPAPQEWTVNFVFQGNLDQSYARKEHFDGEFLARYFGGQSDDGNLYRAIDPDDNNNFPFQGDLRYLGPDPETYRPYYDKRNNEEADDFTDVIELTRVFDLAETPDDETFADQLEQLVDVDQWMRFFAANTCIANTDGLIHTSSGEDYFLYKVPLNSPRFDAGKWLLLPWDIEESLRNARQPVVPTSVASARRFLRHERFAPRFQCALQNLRAGAFSRVQMISRFPLIDFLFDFGTIDGNDTFVASRLGFFDEVIPSGLTSGASTFVDPTTFIDNGETWKFFRGSSEPSGGTASWTELLFDDATWEEGPAGFGYGDGDDATFLDDMENNYTTVYLRRVFQVTDPGSVLGLALDIDYDDGFAAYLNGQLIAQRGVNGSGPFPATAEASDHEAGTPLIVDISEFIPLLEPDDNILAVQGFNRGAVSSDFSLHPALRTSVPGSTSFGCGDVLVVEGGNTISLAGQSDPCRTRSVTINDQPTEYDPFTATWRGAANVGPGESLVTIKAFDRFNIRIETLEVVVRQVTDPLVEVGGTLGGDTVWNPSNGALLLTSDLTVPAGVTLTIEPGTLIFGLPAASIVVNGLIDAQGTPESPILFRAADCGAPWGGIGIDDTGGVTHIVRHCDFDRGDNAPGFAGCLASVDANLLVEHSVFRHINGNAIDGTRGRIEVRNCTFERVREGVHCTSSTVIIQDSFFHRMQGDSDAIDFDLNGTDRSLIERCIFMTGTDDGVDLRDTTVDIRDNIFVGISDKALSLEDNGPLGPSTFSGNIMFGGGTAIALKNGVTIADGHHNTIVGNRAGIHLFAKDGASDGGHATMHSNIVWNNASDVRLDSLSTLDLRHSDVRQGWPGVRNISLDPEFVDVASLDFSLMSNSPCITSGLDGTDMGAIPFDGVSMSFVRGDVDLTGDLGINDAVETLRILFRTMTPPQCVDRVDSNDDGKLDIVDPLVTLFFLFGGGDAPPAPYPNVGVDPTSDDLPCGIEL